MSRGSGRLSRVVRLKRVELGFREFTVLLTHFALDAGHVLVQGGRNWHDTDQTASKRLFFTSCVGTPVLLSKSIG
jgi:hypothetical protein